MKYYFMRTPNLVNASTTEEDDSSISFFKPTNTILTVNFPPWTTYTDIKEYNVVSERENMLTDSFLTLELKSTGSHKR